MLQHFLKSCFFLAKHPNTLEEIAILLDRQGRGQHDHAMNLLHKKKTRKEMRMNFHISDFDVDSVVLDLGSDVNILMKKT